MASATAATRTSPLEGRDANNDVGRGSCSENVKSDSCEMVSRIVDPVATQQIGDLCDPYLAEPYYHANASAVCDRPGDGLSWISRRGCSHPQNPRAYMDMPNMSKFHCVPALGVASKVALKLERFQCTLATVARTR